MSTLGELKSNILSVISKMKENLVSKGVQVSDADTLHTLADKVNDIQGGEKVVLPGPDVSFQGKTFTDGGKWLEDVDTSNLTSGNKMLYKAIGISHLDLKGWDVSKMTTIRECFSDTNIEYLDIRGWDFSSEDQDALLSTFSSVKQLLFDNDIVSGVKKLSSTFRGCTNELIDLSGSTAVVTSLDYTFMNCSLAKEIKFGNFDTSSVKSIRNLFYGCASLETLDMSMLDLSGITDESFWSNSNNKLRSLKMNLNFPNLTTFWFNSSAYWTDETVQWTLVEHSADRVAAGLQPMTLNLHANTKAVLTEEQKEIITNKGYTIA